MEKAYVVSSFADTLGLPLWYMIAETVENPKLPSRADLYVFKPMLGEHRSQVPPRSPHEHVLPPAAKGRVGARARPRRSSSTPSAAPGARERPRALRLHRRQRCKPQPFTFPDGVPRKGNQLVVVQGEHVEGLALELEQRRRHQVLHACG